MLTYRLRHVICIQELVEIQDTNTGAITRSWEPFITSDGTRMIGVPAEVLTGAGKEFVQSGSTQGQIVARINMRWFPGLTQKHRIVWDSNIFNITSIETDVTARLEYRLRCSAGVSDGQ